MDVDVCCELCAGRCGDIRVCREERRDAERHTQTCGTQRRRRRRGETRGDARVRGRSRGGRRKERDG